MDFDLWFSKRTVFWQTFEVFCPFLKVLGINWVLFYVFYTESRYLCSQQDRLSYTEPDDCICGTRLMITSNKWFHENKVRRFMQAKYIKIGQGC